MIFKGLSMSTTRTVEEHYRDLQIEYDERAQRREWLATTVALIVMTLVVVAALYGLLGRGRFSHAEATSADGLLRVEYERVMRFNTDSRLIVTVTPKSDKAGVAIAVPGDRLEISSLQPSPRRIRQERGDLKEYVFDVQPGEKTVLLFDLKPMRVFSLPLSIRLDDASAVTADMVVLP